MSVRSRSSLIAVSWLSLIAGLLAIGAAVQADDLPGSAPSPRLPVEPWPSAIILEPPANRDLLLGKLRQPDLIIWDAEGFNRWLAAGGNRPRLAVASPAAGGVVDTVRFVATVAASEARAEVQVEFRIMVEADGRIEVPIGLNGLVLGRVAEDGRDLRVVSVGESRGWAVELSARGEHRVEVSTAVAVRSGGLGQALELAIPPAGTTEVDLVSARPLAAAGAGAGADEALLITGSAGGSRATGHLSPRNRLDLTWREAEPPGGDLPPILAARGEVAVTVGLDALETRENWSVAAVRGTTSRLIVQLQANEEVLDLTVNRRPVAVDRRPAGDGELIDLIIPLAEPIAATVPGAGAEAKPALVGLTTRRPGSPGQASGSARFAFSGHSIATARSQTGVIGVAQVDHLLIITNEGRGVRRVDPRERISRWLPEPTRGLARLRVRRAALRPWLAGRGCPHSNLQSRPSQPSACMMTGST